LVHGSDHSSKAQLRSVISSPMKGRQWSQILVSKSLGLKGNLSGSQLRSLCSDSASGHSRRISVFPAIPLHAYDCLMPGHAKLSRTQKVTQDTCNEWMSSKQ
jgi:hypothetical protein